MDAVAAWGKAGYSRREHRCVQTAGICDALARQLTAVTQRDDAPDALAGFGGCGRRALRHSNRSLPSAFGDAGRALRSAPAVERWD